MSKWLKTTLKVIFGFIIVVLLLFAGAALYISNNKAKFLKLVDKELFKNIDGIVEIGDMSPQFVKGFPNISLQLENVTIKDKRYAYHHHILLNASNFEVTVNARRLFKGFVDIKHISLSNAIINLYTDSTGYSNKSVFVKRSKKNSSPNEHSLPQLDEFSLSNVELKIDNQKKRKLIDLVINNINGEIDYTKLRLGVNFNLDVLVKSMAFKTSNGSFLKDKKLAGEFTASFEQKSGNLQIISNNIKIGEDPFTLKALFTTAKPNPTFRFDLSCDKLVWRNASALLTPKITLKLNQFNVAQPMGVKAVIDGSLVSGTPNLYITAAIKNSMVTFPGNQIKDCTFNGVFMNYYDKDQPIGDRNSMIKLNGLGGTYRNMPFKIDTVSIVNLLQPITTGNFKANLPLANLNNFFEKNTVVFKKGVAQVDLQYRADVKEYRINKPIIAGNIHIKNADVNYIPSGLDLKNVSASLSFIKNDLIFKNIAVQTGRSSIDIEGRMNNFLDLYYTAPEKILLDCNIRSHQIYLAEFIGLLHRGNHETRKSNNSANFVKQLNTVIHKCNVAVKLNANNLHYNKFLATDVKAKMRTTASGFVFDNVNLKTAGGLIQLNGFMKRNHLVNTIKANTVISEVNVRDFFYSFDSFGFQDLTYQNLKGLLSAQTKITLNITDRAALIPQSLNGDVKVNLKKAALMNFKGLQGVVKYAFPFRNLNFIGIPNLDANFIINGDKIDIAPMQISSSVLNADVAGIYGLNGGTNLTFDIPLRNPKSDSAITDKAELLKKRYRGLVIHLRAKADENGKIKISFNKNRKVKAPN